MYSLLFDVKPKEGHFKHYFQEVDKLNSILATYPGLRWVDRFSNLNDSEALLSLQIWDSEEAISAWRQDKHHLQAQNKGKKEYFQVKNIHLLGIYKCGGFWQFRPVFKNVLIGKIPKVIFGKFESTMKLKR